MAPHNVDDAFLFFTCLFNKMTFSNSKQMSMYLLVLQCSSHTKFEIPFFCRDEGIAFTKIAILISQLSTQLDQFDEDYCTSG